MKIRATSLILSTIFIFSGCGTDINGDNNNTNLDILDDDKPRITLYGEKDIHIPLGTNTVLENDGFIAEDTVDGDLTYSVKRTHNIDFTKAGVYTVTYFVEDSDGYTDTKTRRVTIDNNSNNNLGEFGDSDKPRITLYGNSDIYINLGTTTVLENDSFIATDTVDGDLTYSVTRTDDIDFTRVGVYTVTYFVEDSDGNSDTKTRRVTILDNSSSSNNDNYENEDSDLGTPIGGSGYSAIEDFKIWYYNTCGESFNSALYNASTGRYRGKINCSNKDLDYIDLSTLSVFSAIDTIDLSHNRLTNIDFSPILDIEGLNYLYINNNTEELKRKYDSVSERKALFRSFTNINGGDGETGLFIGFKPIKSSSSEEFLKIIF